MMQHESRLQPSHRRVVDDGWINIFQLAVRAWQQLGGAFTSMSSKLLDAAIVCVKWVHIRKSSASCSCVDHVVSYS